MFGRAFFGARYFAPRYWGDGGVPAPGGGLFGHRYFGARMFGPRYFAPVAASTPPSPATESSHIGQMATMNRFMGR